MYSKSAVTGLVSLCVFAGGLSVSCAAALARSTYGVNPPVLVGSEGSGEGQFSNPTGVAVNEVAPGHIGDVYVVDQGNNRVERFSAAGAYLGEFDGSGTLSLEEAGKAAPAGAFSAPTWIAVDSSMSLSDPSAGDVYVFDSGPNKLEKFSAAGAYIATVEPPGAAFPEGFVEGDTNGLAVDTSGNLWVYTGAKFVYKYNDAEEDAFELGWESAFFSAHPGFGVDSSEHVYLTGSFKRTLEKFSDAGIDEGSLSGTCEEGCTAGLAINQATGELFVARAPEGASPEIQRLDTSGTALQAPFATGSQLSGIGGLAVNATSGDLYVADSIANDLKIYAPATLAEFTTGGVSDEQPTSAVVSATVGPNGLAGSCQVEYGTTTSYGTSVPCSPANYAAGTTGIPVTGTLTGLTSAETYHYRITATNSSATSHSEDQVFRLTPAPLVDGNPGFATNVSQFTATLNGSIDPYDLPTSYHFVYGTTTAYGASIPTPGLYTPVNNSNEAIVPQTIGDLQPGTTYHFALVATAPGGTVTGPDQTFTTPGIPLPEAATGGASGVSEGAVTLTGSVNPQGWNTTYQFQYGTTTAYGANWPSVSVQAGQFLSAQGVSVYLERLQPATTYHYRLLATNPAGTVYGADQTFTTTAYPFSAIQEPTGGPQKAATKLAAPVKKALTNAQKLAAALKTCKKAAKKQRAKCEATARKRYAPVKKKK